MSSDPTNMTTTAFEAKASSQTEYCRRFAYVKIPAIPSPARRVPLPVLYLVQTIDQGGCSTTKLKPLSRSNYEPGSIQRLIELSPFPPTIPPEDIRSLYEECKVGSQYLSDIQREELQRGKAVVVQKISITSSPADVQSKSPSITPMDVDEVCKPQRSLVDRSKRRCFAYLDIAQYFDYQEMTGEAPPLHCLGHDGKKTVLAGDVQDNGITYELREILSNDALKMVDNIHSIYYMLQETKVDSESAIFVRQTNMRLERGRVRSTERSSSRSKGQSKGKSLGLRLQMPSFESPDSSGYEGEDDMIDEDKTPTGRSADGRTPTAKSPFASMRSPTRTSTGTSKFSAFQMVKPLEEQTQEGESSQATSESEHEAIALLRTLNLRPRSTLLKGDRDSKAELSE